MNKKKLYLCTRKWDGSSVGLERMLDRHEVTSSILVRPTQKNVIMAFFFCYTHNLILLLHQFSLGIIWHNTIKYFLLLLCDFYYHHYG